MLKIVDLIIIKNYSFIRSKFYSERKFSIPFKSFCLTEHAINSTSKGK